MHFESTSTVITFKCFINVLEMKSKLPLFFSDFVASSVVVIFFVLFSLFFFLDWLIELSCRNTWIWNDFYENSVSIFQLTKIKFPTSIVDSPKHARFAKRSAIKSHYKLNQSLSNVLSFLYSLHEWLCTFRSLLSFPLIYLIETIEARWKCLFLSCCC